MASSDDYAQIIREYITKDPELPRANPTASYWQHVPHALAHVQSPVIPQETDVVIIGSGMTGVSVARTLLEKDSSSKLVVFEARGLCSGATGRNGGQLATNAGEIYSELRERFGPEQAGRIAAFTFKTCERMEEIISQYAPEEGELRKILKVRAFLDEKSFEEMKKSVQQMENDHPDLRGIYKILDAETVQKEHGVHKATGGVTLPAAALWPYRVVASVFQALLDKHADRLSIETDTPVTKVEYADGIYTVTTPRGKTCARTVIHATNGYAGHLLPKLRGLMFPLRGTMTVQDLGPSVPNLGSEKSFGFHYTPVFDEETNTLADGLWYLTQNAKSGYFFFGGEKGTMDDTLTADDTTVTKTSLDHLQHILPTFFNYTGVKEDPLVAAWSGVMGFTADGAPYVGRIPESITGRHGNGEWIVAGFNGYGMPYCWMAGEALASIVVGEDPKEYLPEVYRVSEERLSAARIDGVCQYLSSLR